MEQDRTKTVIVQLDMTPDGEFMSPPGSPLGNKVLKVALLLAVIAGAGVLATFAFWFAMVLIPIAVGAGLLAYGILRFRIWQASQAQRTSRFR
ncbi:MAG: hypothetical protein P4L66_07245 [Acetobacteraceae bacterium]|nr:hypothetical protein [Acetobacteraceae bacterium]